MRVTVVGSCAALLWALCAPATAQWDDEPEGQTGIVDPELQQVTPSAAGDTPSGSSTASVPSPGARPVTGEISAVLRSRTGMDLRWKEPRQDILTSTQLLSLEAIVRPSEGTRFVVGLRPMHRFSRRRYASPDSHAERYELDVLPGAAHVDLTPAAGVHVRLGYQYLHLGRFDVLSATNVLSANDLRDGPLTFPEASELAQPAARVDWDANMWLSMRLVYVPFFQPHIVSLSDGDYALFPTTQAAVDANIDGMGPLEAMRFRERSFEITTRSGQEAIVQSGFEAFSPVADLTRPQAALRVTAHGPAGELAATVAVANERLPAPWLSQSLIDYLADVTRGNELYLSNTVKPFEIQYNRFFVVSVDGATDLGPLQVGTELAYMFDRTFFAAQKGEVPLPEQSDVVHAGLRIEYVLGQTLAVASEAILAYTLHEPSDPDRQWLMFDDGRLLKGVLGFASWSPGELGLGLELGAAALSGPSYVVLPRAEYALTDGLFVELGAALLYGPAPGIAGSPRFSLAGQYRDRDQVFVGLRFVP